MQMYIRKIILRCNVFELARLLCENTKFAKKFNAKTFNITHMKLLKVALLALFAFGLSTSVFGSGYYIKAKIVGLKVADTCYLGNYYGQYQSVQDTAIANAKGEVLFQGKDDLPGGIYFIILPKKKFFEFIVNTEQKLYFETDTADFTRNMKVTGSKENSMFYDYLRYVNQKQNSYQDLKARLDKLDKGLKDSITYYKELMTKIDDDVKNYKINFMKQNPDFLISKVFKASRDPEIPEAPLCSNGRKDSVFIYRYYKQHYFDDLDFTDDRLLRTPVFYNRLKNYLENVVAQTPDSLIKEADYLAEKARPNKEMFKFVVWYMTYTYETSNVMGFDAIFVHMVRTYYQTNQCYWVSQKILDNLTKRADKIEPILLGKVAPNLIMQDTSLQLQSLHAIKSEYTVLLFWDPECGHCQTEVPAVHDFYLKEHQQLGFEVFAVCSDTNMVKMKNFIKKHNLNGWINVDGPRALTKPYAELYDIYSTPVIYILDKQKVILAKRIPFDKIGEFLKNDIKRKAAIKN
jgi:peroxiredoxin